MSDALELEASLEKNSDECVLVCVYCTCVYCIHTYSQNHMICTAFEKKKAPMSVCSYPHWKPRSIRASLIIYKREITEWGVEARGVGKA
jgi:hypothetical protein